MSTSSPGLNPRLSRTPTSSGLLSRFRKGGSKDLKKLVKEGGEPVYQGYLRKYKVKEAEWKHRWVEIRGSYVMWTSSKGSAKSDYKDFIDLQGAKLIDECSMLGLDASGQPRGKSSAVVYSVEKGKTKNLGTMKQNLALSQDYSFRIVPRSGPEHIFAAEGDHEKEEWWKHILRSIHSSNFANGVDTKPKNTIEQIEDIPLFSELKPVSIPRRQVEFDFLSVVGRGAYGRVIKVREKATGNIYVCKVLEKQAIIRHRMLKEVKKEQALLQRVSHPNIVDLITAFQTRDKIFLVMEFLSGGELFNHMTSERTKRFSVDRACFYAAQLVLAIEYLHSLKIIHCDLKAENCVLTRDGYMKLTDFGFATTHHADEKIISRNGTPVYMAPEMIQVDKDVGYSYPVDCWSLGVLIYAMLTGYFPFHGDTPLITMRYVCERELAYPPDVKVDHLSKDLLAKCLDRNPNTRLTATQMRSHKFFAKIDWDPLYRKKIPPPFVPAANGSNNTTSYESARQAHMDAMVSMHSVHGADTVFSGFPYVRSNSTQSQSMTSQHQIVVDDSADEDYMKKLTTTTPGMMPNGKDTERTPPPLALGDAHEEDTDD